MKIFQNSLAVFAILPSLRSTHANLLSHEEHIQRSDAATLRGGAIDAASRSNSAILSATAISYVTTVAPPISTLSHIDPSALLTELPELSPTFPPSCIPSASILPSASSPNTQPVSSLSIAPAVATASHPSVSPLSPAMPLTGYYVVAQYSDAACLSVLYSESKKLNYCTFNDDKDWTYTLYTASASNFVKTKYSDEACTVVIGSTKVSYSDECNGKVRTFVSDTGLPQSSTLMLSYRCVILFCLVLSRDHINYVLLCNLVSYHSIVCHIAQHYTISCYATLYNAVRYRTVLHSSELDSDMQYHSTLSVSTPFSLLSTTHFFFMSLIVTATTPTRTQHAPPPFTTLSMPQTMSASHL